MSRREVAGFKLEPGQYLGKSRLEDLLARLSPPPDVPASSLYLRPGEAQEFLAAAGPDSRAWAEALEQTGAAAQRSDTGVVGLRSGDRALIIVPPFPVLQDRLTSTWDAEPLLGLLGSEYLIGVVLLRLGRYSAAVYRGETLLSSRTDARYVKGRHRAGGTSQRRFQRIREGQMRDIYEKTCRSVEAQFSPYVRQLDYVLLGGDRITLNNFRKVCPYLDLLKEKILDRRLNIRDPKRDTLEEVGRLVWQSRVYLVEW